MHPELFHIGRFAVKFWGLMMAISVVIGLFISLKRAKKMGVNPDLVYDMVILVVVSSIIGSRIFYVIFHLDEFSGNWLDIINPFSGPGGFGIAGLSMMGGVFLVVICAAVYSLIKKVKFSRLGDVIAPAFLLGAGITRIGCFLNGCCYGRPTTGPFGIIFPDGAAGSFCDYLSRMHPEQHFTGLIPTQLMASALGFILFFVVLVLERWKRFDGYTTWLVLALYSIDRFFVDQFRYYEPKQILGHLGPLVFTVNEIVLIVLFVLSAIMFFLGSRKKSAALK